MSRKTEPRMLACHLATHSHLEGFQRSVLQDYTSRGDGFHTANKGGMTAQLKWKICRRDRDEKFESLGRQHKALQTEYTHTTNERICHLVLKKRIMERQSWGEADENDENGWREKPGHSGDLQQILFLEEHCDEWHDVVQKVGYQTDVWVALQRTKIEQGMGVLYFVIPIHEGVSTATILGEHLSARTKQNSGRQSPFLLNLRRAAASLPMLNIEVNIALSCSSKLFSFLLST